MSNKSKTIYFGVTNDLELGVYEHKIILIDGFTKRYNITNLVYFEIFNSIEDAIRREKQLKNWHR
jgi:putative endonuclease